MSTRVGIVGAGGYSGATLARLITAHPRCKLAFLTSDRQVSERAVDRLGGFFDPSLTFSANDMAMELAPKADVIFLATSADVSATLGPQLASLGKLTIDLSGAFRLTSAEYPEWYGFTHPAPDRLETAFYGLPEVFGAPPEDSTLISNPGCYATAAILALAPVLAEDLVDATGVVVDGKSGASGAGRQSKEPYSFVEVNEDVRAYKPLAHQHTPEMLRALGRRAKIAPTSFAFVPHLLPVSRGLLVTCYARTRPGVDSARLEQCLRAAYGETAFVRVTNPASATLHAAVGTNFAYVGAAARDGMAVIVCSIDNLLKGAAGQAVQNMNLALGLDETLALASLSRSSP